MGWFSKKPKRHYIAVITKYDEREPLKNTIALCIELESIVAAKYLILNQIRMNVIIDNAPSPDEDPTGKGRDECIKMLCFESNGEILHGENALEAIGEALIPSSTFTSSKERDEYYESYTSRQASFCTIDGHMRRTVYGAFLRARTEGEH